MENVVKQGRCDIAIIASDGKVTECNMYNVPTTEDEWRPFIKLTTTPVGGTQTHIVLEVRCNYLLSLIMSPKFFSPLTSEVDEGMLYGHNMFLNNRKWRRQ